MPKLSELSSIRNKIHDLSALTNALASFAAALPVSPKAERIQSLCNMADRLAADALASADALIDALDVPDAQAV